ncbi:MAG: nucleotide pyrophosphohydrolase [Candidatus Saccharibacteria bacterium]|nr:nucleotide pyrophosphohydrolase [Candidatus Saccharibacteria bacterium]
MSESPLADMARQCLSDSERWFGDQPHIIHSIPYHTLAMAGEVGEFANVVKKIQRGSLDMKDAKVRVQLASELTDVFVYILNIAALMNIDLGKTYEMVRANNERRFSQQRKEREAKNV